MTATRTLVSAALRAIPALLLLAAAPARTVTIYRDTYGVPHIYATTDAGAAFGLMYAQAEDNFWQLEEDYIRMLGRVAEIDGPRGLANDILVRAYESEKRAKEHYAHGGSKRHDFPCCRLLMDDHVERRRSACGLEP